MKDKFTTTLEEDTILKIKLEAVIRKCNVNDILEEIIKQYFTDKKGE